MSCVSLMEIEVKPTQTLKLCVSCWQHLDITHPHKWCYLTWPHKWCCHLQHFTWNDRSQDSGHGWKNTHLTFNINNNLSIKPMFYKHFMNP
jgi:hypothetical protein